MQSFTRVLLLAGVRLGALLSISLALHASDGPAPTPPCGGVASSAPKGMAVRTPCPMVEPAPSQVIVPRRESVAVDIDAYGRVELRGRLLSVTLTDAPLPAVLKGVGSLAGFDVKADGRTKRLAINDSFREMPLEAGMQRLLRQVDHFLVWAEAGEERKIEKVVVLGIKEGASTSEVESPSSVAEQPHLPGLLRLPIEEAEVLEQLKEQLRAAGIDVTPMGDDAAEMIRKVEKEAERALLEYGLPEDVLQHVAPHLDEMTFGKGLQASPPER